ncbi:MAG: hypothetical protein DRO15_00900 [Thermoprotei archaeon]|nr:MAG: hypothetical protein DRO15_00900 [Thermoprotei archaeon]
MWLANVDPERKLEFKDRKLYEQLSSLSMEAKKLFVECLLKESLNEAREWIDLFNKELERAAKAIGAIGWLFSKEFRSFLVDPEAHLIKKLFIYFHDVLRGRISLEEFEEKGRAAIRTSLRTNMRSLYQNWGLAAILESLGRNYNAKILYPEHKYVSLERSGKQRTGTIPPNIILKLSNGGELSFFLEAPRPVSWADTHDLQRVWKLYTTLRPDLLIYGGRIMNILDLSSEPPIKRPNIVLEFKELEDWYVRIRDLRGPFIKRLSAEEWRSRWVRGLWEGLADVLGVKREVLEEDKKLPATALRVHETKLIQLYKAVYKPDKMLLVCRAKMPENIASELESVGIIVYHDVGFDASALEPVADEIARFSKRVEPVYITSTEIRKILGIDRVDESKLLEALVKFLKMKREEFKRFLESQ